MGLSLPDLDQLRLGGVTQRGKVRLQGHLKLRDCTLLTREGSRNVLSCDWLVIQQPRIIIQSQSYLQIISAIYFHFNLTTLSGLYDKLGAKWGYFNYSLLRLDTLPIAQWNPSNMDTPGCPD